MPNKFISSTNQILSWSIICLSFWLHDCCGKWEDWSLKPWVVWPLQVYILSTYYCQLVINTIVNLLLLSLEHSLSYSEHSLPYSDVTIYIFWYIIFITYTVCVSILWPLRLGWLLVCCLYKEVYLQIFKCVSFWLYGCCGEWEGLARKPVNHTSWMAVVTPTDRPKSVRNRCVIELFCGVVLPLCPFDISAGVVAFVIGLSQISSSFSV